MSEEHSGAPSRAPASDTVREHAPRMFLPEDLPEGTGLTRTLPPAWDAGQLSPGTPVVHVPEDEDAPRASDRPAWAGLVAGAALGIVASMVVSLVMIVDPTAGGAVAPLIGVAVVCGVTGLLGRMPARLAAVAAVLAGSLYIAAVLGATGLSSIGVHGHGLGEAMGEAVRNAPAVLVGWFAHPSALAFLALAMAPVPVASTLLGRRRT